MYLYIYMYILHIYICVYIYTYVYTYIYIEYLQGAEGYLPSKYLKILSPQTSVQENPQTLNHRRFCSSITVSDVHASDLRLPYAQGRRRSRSVEGQGATVLLYMSYLIP